MVAIGNQTISCAFSKNGFIIAQLFDLILAFFQMIPFVILAQTKKER